LILIIFPYIDVVELIGDYKLNDNPTLLTLGNSVVTGGLSSISLGKFLYFIKE